MSKKVFLEGINSPDSRMMEFLRQLSALPRMIIGEGLDETFALLKEGCPELTIHEYPSGMECDDWIMPESWKALEGSLETEEGVIVASLEESYLFAAPFSEPVDDWVTKSELVEHTCTRKDVPRAYALEHRVAYDYQFVDWRISVPYERLVNLTETDMYHVRLEVEKKPGSMKVGEFFRQGASDKTIVFCAHIDELCNDDLSGCAVAYELIRRIKDMKKPRYSYQVLFVPEMFGTLFYVKNNLERVKNTVCMVNLETLGAGEELILKKAKNENTIYERAMRRVLKDAGVKFSEASFFEVYGNDERVYAWPTIGVPGFGLQRYPFRQYHTSDDTPEIIDENYLLEGLRIIHSFMEVVENNAVPEFTKLLPPWLTKHNLYHDCQIEVGKFQKLNNYLLYNVNGVNSLLDLSEIADLRFDEIRDYLASLADKGFVRYLGVAR